MAKRRKNKEEENEDELCARNWLRQQGYRDIRRPCDDPPDFVVDGCWAVEVTRLNQRVRIGDDKRSRGEEEARIPLTQCLEEVICRLGPPGNEGKSWVIDCKYDFSNPKWLESYWPKVKINSRIVDKQVSEALAPLLQPYDMNVVSYIGSRYFDDDRHAGEMSDLNPPHLCLECGICLELGEFSHSSARFIVQNVSDGKSIKIATELSDSIRNRIEAKSITVRKKNRIESYENWWLVLIDHVSRLPLQALFDREQAFVRDQNFEFWSRVTIVSSLDVRWHYDLLTTVPDHVNSSHRQ